MPMGGKGTISSIVHIQILFLSGFCYNHSMYVFFLVYSASRYGHEPKNTFCEKDRDFTLES